MNTPSLKSLAFASCLMSFGLVASTDAFGCASCGCSLSSNWESQGYYTDAGFKMDVIYTFINQTQLRSGTHQISGKAVPDGQELEKSTRNNFINLDLDYVINSDWAVNFQLPWIIRDHDTWGEDHHSFDTTSLDSIGDIRLMASYQGFSANHNFGVQLGLKLPTGSFNQTFRDGEDLDRGLQPGSGTTDLLAGVYYFDSLCTNWGYFGLANVQTALDSRSGYRPGTAENLSLGVRYTGFHGVVPQLQLNGRISNRDTGVESDNFDSGGTLVYVSPGVTIELTPRVSTYVFVQIPIYQNVNGYQLAPTWTLSAGFHVSF